MTTPTPPDFRALCVELLEAVEHEYGDSPVDRLALSRRARAALEAQPEPVDDRIAELEAELERERLRLAACGVVAMADTPEAAKAARDMHADYWSASLDDVIRQVDALMKLRLAALEAQPEPVGPTDDEIDALVICIQALPAPGKNDLALQSIDQGRGMVRQALARWGRPGFLEAQPEPVGPTDEELEATARAAEVQSMKKQCGLTASTPNGIHAQLQEQRLAGLRAIAARWGRPVALPVAPDA